MSKKKPAKIAKTQVVFDLKPEDAETDLKVLEADVRKITMDGLSWGQEFGVADVAFGIKKLVVQCVIEDEKVFVDDLEDKIYALEGAQSMDIIASAFRNVAVPSTLQSTATLADHSPLRVTSLRSEQDVLNTWCLALAATCTASSNALLKASHPYSTHLPPHFDTSSHCAGPSLGDHGVKSAGIWRGTILRDAPKFLTCAPFSASHTPWCCC